jgi:thiamine kinase-like enzyme
MTSPASDLPPHVTGYLRKLPLLGGKEHGIEPLPGGITNRNYRITCGGEEWVLRVAGEDTALLGIDRETEHACARSAHAAGIGPEVLAFSTIHKVLVTRFVAGTVLEPKTVRAAANLRDIATALRCYHENSASVGSFSPFETVRRYLAQAQEREVPLPVELDRALKIFARIEREVGVPERLHGCHNDLLAGNLIRADGKIWIIDWEYAGMGDRFFDLGNLAANNGFSPVQERALLRYYFGVVRPDDLARLRLMRLASDMREAMWGFLQAGISKLDFDYQKYARRYLRRFLRRAAQGGVV